MVRPGDRNEELRYSLRSLVNLPHDRVIIIGYRPAWVSTDVAWLPVNQDGPKHENTWRLWQAMTAVPSESFILMNDDFFITRPHPAPPRYHAGGLDEWVYRLGSIGTVRRMRHTIAALSEVCSGPYLSYEVHAPMALARDLLTRAMEVGNRYREVSAPGAGPLCKRTLYGNLAGIGGSYLPDPKVRDTTTVPGRNAGIVSTSDESFGYGRVGQWIADRFPDPSPYERTRPAMPVRGQAITR